MTDRLIQRIEAEREAATGIGLKHVRLHYTDVDQLLDLCKTLAAGVRASQPAFELCKVCGRHPNDVHAEDCPIGIAKRAIAESGL